MRKLVLLRGLPGSGKSSWIKEMGKEVVPRTLSSDAFRLILRSPETGLYGQDGICGNITPQAWSMLFLALEIRMKAGEFTIVDATHIKEKDINGYRSLAEKYRYETVIVDFTNIPLEEVKRRNATRKGHYSYVPENVIEKLDKLLATQKVPEWVKVVTPEEFQSVVSVSREDFSDWKKIHHIGDLQSSYTPLLKLLSEGLKDDELYIFVGDFLDRGTEHSQVLSFILENFKKPNVILVEGNHEAHLWDWANDKESNSEEFESKTRPILEQSGFDKKLVRRLCRSLREALVYTYGDKTVLVSHGGFPYIPSSDEMVFISSQTFIKGAGVYRDDIDEAFNAHPRLKVGDYQVHGHRNSQGNPIRNGRSWNLEAKVEFGGYLRAVSLDKKEFSAVEILNEIGTPVSEKTSTPDLLERLRSSKFIKERVNPHGISSFNFSKSAFYDGVWNAQTVKARGLFIHTELKEIVARSYDKFFNVGELSLTTMTSLEHNLRFPVDIYVKENGYLGIIGYDKHRDELIIASKSTTEGDFAGWFRELVEKTLDQKSVKSIVREGLSLVFEVIDPIHDPHIIKYSEPKLILLDIVKNKEIFEKLPFEEVVASAQRIGCEAKRLHKTLSSFEEFKAWHAEVTKPDFKLGGIEDIEGFVIEDARLFMTKIKLSFYSFWKFMRTLKDKHRTGKTLPDSVLDNAQASQFIAWLKSTDQSKADLDIISLREMFEKSK